MHCESILRSDFNKYMGFHIQTLLPDLANWNNYRNLAHFETTEEAKSAFHTAVNDLIAFERLIYAASKSNSEEVKAEAAPKKWDKAIKTERADAEKVDTGTKPTGSAGSLKKGYGKKDTAPTAVTNAPTAYARRWTSGTQSLCSSFRRGH